MCFCSIQSIIKLFHKTKFYSKPLRKRYLICHLGCVSCSKQNAIHSTKWLQITGLYGNLAGTKTDGNWTEISWKRRIPKFLASKLVYVLVMYERRSFCPTWFHNKVWFDRWMRIRPCLQKYMSKLCIWSYDVQIHSDERGFGCWMKCCEIFLTRNRQKGCCLLV